jgi:hypothetical protein
VVGAEYLGMNDRKKLFGGFAQIPTITISILFGIKTGLAVMSTLYDMLWNSGKVKRGLRAISHLLVVLTYFIAKVKVSVL